MLGNILYDGVLAYEHGFHGPVMLFISSDKHLYLRVAGKIVYSSAHVFADRRGAVDGEGWAEAAFQ